MNSKLLELLDDSSVELSSFYLSSFYLSSFYVSSVGFCSTIL